MIAVIADDITGAAELGGIALQFDLKVVITSSVLHDSHADVMIISTDSRSLSQEQAMIITKQVCNDLMELKPTLIYKKIDSVLRGHILAEIGVQQEVFDEPKALIIPANPSLGRTIDDGEYLLDGKKIHESDFSNDAEFPIHSSVIADMLRVDKDEIHVLQHAKPLPVEGFIVGEVLNKEDLFAWVNKISNETVVSGAAEFFLAILERKFIQNQSKVNGHFKACKPVLIIRGSSFYGQENDPGFTATDEIRMYETPADILHLHWLHSTVCADLVEGIVHDLSSKGQAGICIPPKDQVHFKDPVLLRMRIGDLCGMIVSKCNIAELIIEGGSTAAAILRALEINTLYPVQSLGRGVLRMSVKEKPGLHITVKPGSYAWPSKLTGMVRH